MNYRALLKAMCVAAFTSLLWTLAGFGFAATEDETSLKIINAAMIALLPHFAFVADWYLTRKPGEQFSLKDGATMVIGILIAIIWVIVLNTLNAYPVLGRVIAVLIAFFPILSLLILSTPKVTK